MAEVARLFAVLGATAFGGPAAHVAMMRREFVERRGWEDEQTFVDLVGLTALLPGPNSTELAIEMGRRRAGTAGLVAAGVAFVVPAALLVGAIAAAYERYGTTPAADDLRGGILPVVVAIVAHATWALGRTAVRGPLTAVIAVAAFAAQLAGVHELVILAVGAAAGGLWAARGRLATGASSVLLVTLPAALAAPATVSRGGGDPGESVGLAQLAWSFLRIGATLFGSGYVIVAFLEAEFVDRLGALTPTELLDAVTVGQVTPGPVFTTATFVGYVTDGPWGAAVATVAIFLPAFLLIAALGRFVGPALRSPTARPLLDGLNAAAVGLIAAAAVGLADDGITSALGVALAVVALALLLRTKLNATWLVLAGALLGPLA